MQNIILASLPALLPIEEATSSLGGTTGPDLSQYFLVCGILIAVIAAVAIGMRKLLAGTYKTRASQRALHVIDVMSMGGRRKIAVVRCYDRTFVLGLGEKEITPIAELDPVIGSEVQAAKPRQSDQEAFEVALAKISESMPEKTLMAKLLEAQDAVTPSLAQKMAEMQQPPSVQPQAPMQVPLSAPAEQVLAQKVTKKRVRRKVAKRTQPASPRRLEAQAIASAALDMAAAKRMQPAAPISAPVASAPTPSTKPATPEQPPILRLEGILG